MPDFNLHLPKTAFPLKRKNTESTMQDALTSLDASDYDTVLHDGPPYANGDLHMGHFLNKVLKDVNNRYWQTFNNKKVSFRPGWDCHGLPIEWKVEEQYNKDKKDKSDVLSFRNDCRSYADKWVDEQKKQFKSFGVMAEWDNCYTTHSFGYEAHTLKNLFKLQEKGLLEHRFRPVWWSPAEKTTMAEAELEHQDVEVESLFLEFPVDGEDFSVLVWTTTPWTLPGNQAVAFNSNCPYVVAKTLDGKKLVMSENSFNCFGQVMKLEKVSDSFDTNLFKGKSVLRPFGGTSKMFHFDGVHEMVGAGFLHVVPGHGFVDFGLGVEHNLNLESLVDDDAMMEVNGKRVHVFKADEAVYEYLETTGLTFYKAPKKPSKKEVSWRSKKPLLVKTLKNWFFNLESVQQGVVEAAKEVKWYPENSVNRFTSMVEGRSEWCLSRQRAWGVPMALFVHKETGEMLVDPKVNEYLVHAFENFGSDVWYQYDANFLLPEKYHDQYDKVMDVLDVWFDSGSSLKAVYPDLDQADMYLEGSDQHRGWFQSSAFLHYALYGKLPFKSVTTHGFVTQRNNKLSKSAGNASMTVKQLMDKHGPDTLRLLVSRCNSGYNMELNEETLRNARTAYDKVRNTMRFCFSNLNGYVETNVELRPLDRWVLSKVNDLMVKYTSGNKFNSGFSLELEQLCVWLSTFYYSVVKDTLYCDSTNNNNRQAVLKTLKLVSESLLLMASPVMPFLVEEAKLLGFEPGNRLSTVDYSNLGYWQFVEEELEEVRKGFEVVKATHGYYMEQLTVSFNSQLPVDWKELLGCAEYVNWDVKSTNFRLFEGKKCLRCRTYHSNVTVDNLCNRCEEVENEFNSSV